MTMKQVTQDRFFKVINTYMLLNISVYTQGFNFNDQYVKKYIITDTDKTIGIRQQERLVFLKRSSTSISHKYQYYLRENLCS